MRLFEVVDKVLEASATVQDGGCLKGPQQLPNAVAAATTTTNLKNNNTNNNTNTNNDKA